MTEYEIHDTWVVDISYNKEKVKIEEYRNSEDWECVLNGLITEVMKNDEVSMAFSTTMDNWLKYYDLKLVKDRKSKVRK
jgi:hypothetical protein